MKISLFKVFACVVAFLSVITCACAETMRVKNIMAMQQYPWEGKVRISYEVEGDVATSAENGGALYVMATDKITGKSYLASDAYLTGDIGVATGLHKIIWDVEAQGISINSSKVIFSVGYKDEIYLVIDLSAGASATSYTISYLSAIPSGGWTDEYKTSKIVLRRINTGTYKMQNTSNVTLTRPFYIGIFEVTQKQYQLVMGSNPSYYLGAGFPVERVSYDMIRGSFKGAQWPLSTAVDSDSFIGKLRARTGLDFDLPTEAQWEYACRAGTTAKYYWGDSWDNGYGWCKENSQGDSGYTTHVVGLKSPNAWGLYDMSGNVHEWCLDWYSTLVYGTDPKGPESGSVRVFRGGSWGTSASGCSSSSRYNDVSPSTRNDAIGFRLLRTL